jgi:tRNA A-37 threonylcarbamoyl transferase component Bud32
MDMLLFAFDGAENNSPAGARPMNSEALTTETIAALPSEPLVRGRWIKADVSLVEWQGEKLVVKSFARKSLLVRWIGRPQVKREALAYRALEDIPGIPKLRAWPNPDTLVMDYLEGRRVTHLRLETGSNRGFVDELWSMLEEVHRRGVAHMDLRGRDNLLVSPDGHVRMIDFAASHIAPEGSLRRRLLFPLLRSIDRSAFLKWKRLLTPEDLTEREKKKLRRYQRWRRLWPFNRKELGPSDRAALEKARRERGR